MSEFKRIILTVYNNVINFFRNNDKNYPITSLVGQLALRTAPVYYSNGCIDYSYTDSPIRILKVTDTQIYYTNPLIKNQQCESILDQRYLDNNWTKYNPVKTKSLKSLLNN